MATENRSVALLLERHANVNYIVPSFGPVLSSVARLGDRALATARLLLEHEAIVDSTHSSGFSTLHHASISDSAALVRLLLEHKGSVNARTTTNLTPLVRHSIRETYPEC